MELDSFRVDDLPQAYLQELNQAAWRLTWLGDLRLRAEIAEKPEGLAAVPQLVGEKIHSNLNHVHPV